MPESIVTCEDNMVMMSRYPDKFFDLAIVDPEYGIDINKSGRLGHYGGKGKKWDSKIPEDAYFIELFRVSKNQIIWGGNYFYLPPTRGFLIWDKCQPEDVSFASCEFAWTSFDVSAKTYYQRPQNADRERIHPTQKPVALYRWQMKKFAKEGDKILDTHVGSQSSRIAAYDLQLDYYGCELDPDYFRDGNSRFERETKQHNIFHFLNFK